MKYIISLISILAFTQIAHAKYKKETKEVVNMLTQVDVHSRFNYCIPNTLTCRTLVLLKNKSDGQLTGNFYDNFVSSERSVASTGYFIKNTNSNNFHAYLDQVFDGVPKIDLKFSENQNLQISFDANNFPTITDLTLKNLGSTKYLLATMTYSATSVTLVGVERDTADLNYSRNVNVTYPRVM